MAARRLWGNPRRKGKLTGGQCTAIEKRREHRGSSRLPDQRRDLGDERARNHLPYVSSDPVGLLAEQFDGDRTLMASRPAFARVTHSDRCWSSAYGTKCFRPEAVLWNLARDDSVQREPAGNSYRADTAP